MTYYPGGDPDGPNDGYPGSLFAVGHDHHQMVSEISIPAPVISATKNVEELNTAETLQEFRDITGGCFGELELPRAGFEYLPSQEEGKSGWLHFCWGEHLQFERAVSHGRCELDLSTPKLAGPWYLGEYTNTTTTDYLFEIPQAWADAHAPEQRLATGRFQDGGAAGWGPALFAYEPPNEDSLPARGETVTKVTPLLLYGIREPGVPELTVSEEMKMTTYKHPDEWTGGAWLTVGDKSAVIFVGIKAVGKAWYGYSNGVEYPTSGDPNEPVPEVPPWPHDSRGWWSERIEAQVFLYDPNDLADVARGAEKTWEPQPYATLNIDKYLFDPGYDHEREKRYTVGAVSFDRARGILYILERRADADKSLVHVFKLEK